MDYFLRTPAKRRNPQKAAVLPSGIQDGLFSVADHIYTWTALTLLIGEDSG